MRAVLVRDTLTLPPGVTVKVPLDVTNTLEVIDGISASVNGGLGMSSSAEPSLLPLFPESTGTITLALTVSRQYPAGSYEVPIEVRSAAAPTMGLVEWLPIIIPPQPAATLTVLPAVGASRRRTRFSVVVDNTGNVPMDMRLAASDPDHAVRVRFAEPVLSVAPGSSAETELVAVCRRRLLGSDLSRQITLVATSSELEVDTRAVFRHRPLIPRGARTVLILAAIVAVWAAIFVIALEKALANDPLTKQAPASFYASSPVKGDRSQLDALGGSDSYGLAATDGGPPAGAVPKSGVVIGVGGTISGTVEARSIAAGIGRITVQAIRDSTHGPVLVSSAATASDGTYSLAGLLPGAYEVHFSAVGYTGVWYPKATSSTGAKPVNVDARGQTPNIDATIAGETGSITGTVDTGQSPAPPVTVTVTPQQATALPVSTVVANSSGHYVIPDLPTPGIYDLSFSASGYQVGTDNEELIGGQHDTANTVVLTASAGSIDGTVTDASEPVGGVTITAAADSQTFSSATPTSGAVGQFTLANLPTPATYLLTFSKAGYGTRTVAEILGPGQSLTSIAVSLSGGAGDVDGQVEAHGVGLGGVTVTVDGSSHPPTTQTLTTGDVGAYALAGLTTPETLTLTFSFAGYQSQTRTVAIGSSGAAIVPTVDLRPATGTVKGVVVPIASSNGASASSTGVTVSVTNGRTTESSSASVPGGSYYFTGLAAGAYSVTFDQAGAAQQTVTVILAAGADDVLPKVTMRASPATSGSSA